jgi:hypothetical protein
MKHIFIVYIFGIIIIEKAFDKVEHNAIIQIMETLGFGSKWIGWIKELFASTTSSVLLNWVPGKKYIAREG